MRRALLAGCLFLAELAAAVVYSKSLGGSGVDRANAVALDRAGNAWIAGFTASADFPVRNAAQARFGGGDGDAFVAKLDPRGDVLWATYLGGSGADEAARVEIDARGNVYVTGTTRSADFPVTSDAYQRTARGGTEAFFAKFGPEGQLLYATYFGGDGNETGNALLVDAAGYVAIGGETNSSNLPVTAGALFRERRGGTDGFVAVFDPAGRQLTYATYFGGAGDDALAAMALGQGGNLYLTGQTTSGDLPVTPGAPQRALAGQTDAYLARLSRSRDALEFLTYWGGGAADSASDVLVDLAEMVYIGGTTASANFPVVPAGITSYRGGSSDAFLAQFAFERSAGAAGLAAAKFGEPPRRALGSLAREKEPIGRREAGTPSGSAGPVVASGTVGGPQADRGRRLNLTAAIFFKLLLRTDSLPWTDTIPGKTACSSPGPGSGFGTLGQNNGLANPYLRCLGTEEFFDLATNARGAEVLAGAAGSDARIEVFDQGFTPLTTTTQPDGQFTATQNTGKAGDPVGTATGELFEDELDLALGGPLPLSFVRHYGSNLQPNRLVRSALGANWMHNFDLAILFNQNRTQAFVVLYRGKAAGFNLAGANWTPQFPLPVDYQLSFDGQFFRFFDPSERLIYTFFSSGQLGRIDDLNGNGLVVTQGTNGPTRAADGLGRSLDFTYSGTQLTRITDQSGRFVEFTYSGGELASVTHADGRRSSYQYTSAGTRTALLTRRTLPEGNVPLTQQYDATGRVVRQSDSRGNGMRLEYDTPDPRYSRITAADGAVTLHRATNFNILTETVDPEGGVTSFEYDFAGHRTGVQDRNGRVTGAIYNTQGSLLSASAADGATLRAAHADLRFNVFTYQLPATLTLPDGTTRRFAYDARGNLTSYTDGAGQSWTMTYNARGQRTALRTPSGGSATADYNADGTVAATRLLTGETVRFEYDNLKRPVRVVRGDSSAVRVTYDARDRVTSLTDGRGQTTTYAYDGNGRVTAVRDANQAQTRLAYDGDSRPTTITNAVGAAARRNYDPVGRDAGGADAAGVERRITYDRRGYAGSVADAAGTVATVARDPEGVPTAITNGAGQTWSIETDPRRRPVAITDPAGNPTRIAWDTLSRPLGVTDPLGGETRFSYDAAGRLERLTLPEGETVRLGYNADSRVSQVTDPRGNVWRMDRDAAGRVTARTGPTGLTTRYDYNARGLLAKITRADNTTAAFTYDENGRLTREDDSDGIQISYTRDNVGRITRANGVTLAYDAAGRVTESNGIRNEYDGAGRITAVHYDPSRAVRYTYDNRGLLTRITDWANRVWEFDYDAARRPLRDRRPNGVATSYSYGADGRLSGIAHVGGKVNLTSTFERDANGRVVQATGQPAPPLAPGTQEFAYLADNRVQGREYDGRGNTVRDGGRRFVWNARNQLTRVTGPVGDAPIEYDAFGTPVRIGDSRYVWNYATQPPTLMAVRAASTSGAARKLGSPETDTRAFRGAVVNRFLVDPQNRWLYPHPITKYGELFYLELFGANSIAVAGTPDGAPDDVRQYLQMGSGAVFETSAAGDLAGALVTGPFGEFVEASGTYPFLSLDGLQALATAADVALADGAPVDLANAGRLCTDCAGIPVYATVAPDCDGDYCGGTCKPQRRADGVQLALLDCVYRGGDALDLAGVYLFAAPLSDSELARIVRDPPDRDGSQVLLTAQHAAEPIPPKPPVGDTTNPVPVTGPGAPPGAFTLGPLSPPFIPAFDDVARACAARPLGIAVDSEEVRIPLTFTFFGNGAFSAAERRELGARERSFEDPPRAAAAGRGECILKYANTKINVN